jgi:putative oxidoreductase
MISGVQGRRITPGLGEEERMSNTFERGRHIAELPPFAYAMLMTRIGLGVMYLAHALMMSSVLGLEHASHYLGSIGLPASLAYAMTVAELVGAALLLAGLYVRQVAIALLPFLVGAALLHLATGIGASIGFAIYFLVSFAGQGLLAGWTVPAGLGEEE